MKSKGRKSLFVPGDTTKEKRVKNGRKCMDGFLPGSGGSFVYGGTFGRVGRLGT
ncbi:hypothetical protein D3C83_247640 [compost metagenome]